MRASRSAGGVAVREAGGEGADLGPELLGLGRQVDRRGTGDAPPGEVGDLLGRCGRVDEGGEGGRPAQEHVGVVLEGVGDAAVDLDVELGVEVGRGHGEGGGGGGRQRQLVTALRRGPGRVPHRGGAQLDGHQHVGAVVLDGLEGRDGTAELHPLLGVLGGRLGGLAGQAHGLGRHQGAGEVDEDLGGAGQQGGRGPVEGQAGAAAGGVEVGRDLPGHAVTGGVDDGDVVADGHQHHVGGTAAEDDGGAVGGAAAHLDAVGQADPTEGGAGGQAGQEAAPGGLVAGGHQHRAGDHAGQEGPGGDGGAEGLDHDGQLGHAVAGAAVLLGHVQAGPPECAQVVPERGEGFLVGLQQGAGGAAGVVLAQEVRRRVGQRQVVLGDRDRHARDCTARPRRPQGPETAAVALT